MTEIDLNVRNIEKEDESLESIKLDCILQNTETLTIVIVGVRARVQ